MTVQYKVWWVPQVPGEAFEVSVPNLSSGVLLCDTLAKYDAFQYQQNIKPDYANVGGIQVLFPGEDEWESIDYEDADDLKYVRDRLVEALSASYDD